MSSEYPKRKRRETEYARAVAGAERDTRFYVAQQLKATVPDFRIKIDRDIAELQLAWRDMSPEEKQSLINDTIRKWKNFGSPKLPKSEKAPSPTIHVDPMERSRQIEALYLLMTPEQRAEYDNRKRLT